MRKKFHVSTMCLISLFSIGSFAQTATSIKVNDTRDTNEPPNFFEQEIRADLKQLSTTGISSAYGFSTNLTISPWTDASAGYVHQLNFNNNGLFYRNGDFSSSWNEWNKLIMSDLSGNVNLENLKINSSFEFGSDADNTNSSFVILGPNSPSMEAGKRDILFNFKHAGQCGIRAFRGNEWGTYLQLMTSQPGDATGTPRVRMHIDEYGKIGIGTINPSNELDVNGTIKSQTIQTNTVQSEGDFRFGTFIPVGSWGHRLWFSHMDDNTDPIFMARYNTGQDASELRVSIGDCIDGRDKFLIGYTNLADFAFTPTFAVQADGKVGINTNNPQNELDVNGTIRAKEIKVESNWADFVFKKDYKLPSLGEVKKHIEEKGTLPGVPSESDVKANGVNLGEVNAILLQKIEELTLYVIKQQEEIELLKEKVK